MSKNIAINALSALRGGGQTYLINLLNEVAKFNDSPSIILITNTKNYHVFQKYSSDKIRLIQQDFASKNIFFRVFWETFCLAKFFKEHKITCYFAPGGVMTTLFAKDTRIITALRNMLPFDDSERKRFPLYSYSRFKLWILKHVFLFSYKMSDGVIFISNHSRNEVVKFIPDICERSKVIYHGLNDEFLLKKNVDKLPFHLVANNYYLYVSILDFYKAQKEVIKSWIKINKNGFPYPLILVGPKYNKYGEEVEKMALDAKKYNIHYIGAVEYNDLPSLYQNARALIFASSCECCPNILLEKLASGRPVISSNILPMPEFGGDSVIYFNPYVESELEFAVHTLEQNNNIELYANKSLLRAKDFSWSQTTKETFSYLLCDD